MTLCVSLCVNRYQSPAIPAKIINFVVFYRLPLCPFSCSRCVFSFKRSMSNTPVLVGASLTKNWICSFGVLDKQTSFSATLFGLSGWGMTQFLIPLCVLPNKLQKSYWWFQSFGISRQLVDMTTANHCVILFAVFFGGLPFPSMRPSYLWLGLAVQVM